MADTPRHDPGLRMFEEMLERMPLDELLVTIAEAAVILGVSEGRVKQMMRQPNYERYFVVQVSKGRTRPDPNQSYHRPHVILLLRHPMEELARLRREFPHRGGGRPWKPLARLRKVNSGERPVITGNHSRRTSEFPSRALGWHSFEDIPAVSRYIASDFAKHSWR